MLRVVQRPEELTCDHSMSDPKGIPRAYGGQRTWRRLSRLLQPAWRGVLWRTTPVSDGWGFDRGTPVDRFYIQRFLTTHSADIKGRVLEVSNSDYTNRYGTAVEVRDVLDIDVNNERATFVADLAHADEVPADTFDCFILTQTLHLIYDTRAALRHAQRVLRPGGVMLATLPAVSRISGRIGPDHEYWRFTRGSARELCMEAFGRNQVEVWSDGNVLTAVAFLSGFAFEELTSEELEVNDPYFPLVISVRAVKTR